MGPEALIIALRQSEPDSQLSTPKICSMDKRSSLPSSGGLDAKPAAAPPGLSQREAMACTGLITEEGKQRSRWNAIRMGPRRYRLFHRAQGDERGRGFTENLVGYIAGDQVERLI